MTFTIELDDDLAQQLEARATQTQMTPHEMAIVGLRDYLQKTAPTSSTRSDETNEEFEAVARRVIERDLELLKRLAK